MLFLSSYSALKMREITITKAAGNRGFPSLNQNKRFSVAKGAIHTKKKRARKASKEGPDRRPFWKKKPNKNRFK